uniref:sn-1-specific diacylglycerol lipase ABHD11 n=1 Tax=Glossina palpalis gambiensis TaxID=67801 RepID=A0A1B0ASW5_9MUSC
MYQLLCNIDKYSNSTQFYLSNITIMLCNRIKHLSIGQRLYPIKNHVAAYCSNIQAIDMSYDVFETKNSDNNLSPLIIMHGLFGSKQNWRGVGRALASKMNRKVITVDARNHGNSPHTDDHGSKSMAADIVQLMHRLNFQKISVLGHSMGGRTMMYFALKYPEMVDKGIIADISPISIPGDISIMSKILLAMKNINIPSDVPMAAGRQLANAQLIKVVPSKETVDFVLLNLRRSDDGKYYWIHNVDALYNNMSGFTKYSETIGGLPPFKGPIMFICGKNSPYVDPNHWPQIQNIFPNSEIHWLDAGHLVHFDQAAKFIELTVNFLNK